LTKRRYAPSAIALATVAKTINQPSDDIIENSILKLLFDSRKNDVCQILWQLPGKCKHLVFHNATFYTVTFTKRPAFFVVAVA
jgi:hypothetical protein